MTELAESPTTATGPRTPEGKAISSQNATRTGLYAARDFILEGEEDEYAECFNDLMRELDPQTPLEKLFATEIVSANWRLRRCRLLEAGMALQTDSDEKTQPSVDRARAQSHVILRRSLNELRKLQTERAVRAHINLPGISGLADTLTVFKVAGGEGDAEAPPAKDDRRISMEDLEALMTQADKRLCEQIRAEGVSSFCKTDAPPPVRRSKTPRNALCPCRSGRKYKKCCGNPAKEALKPAA